MKPELKIMSPEKSISLLECFKGSLIDLLDYQLKFPEHLEDNFNPFFNNQQLFFINKKDPSDTKHYTIEDIHNIYYRLDEYKS